MEKLSALSEETCVELTVTTKRWKLTERDHSIKTRLAKAKEQAKQLTVAERTQRRTHSKEKEDMALYNFHGTSRKRLSITMQENRPPHSTLDTLVADFPDTYKLAGQDEVSKTYSFPKSFIKYRKPRAVNIGPRERARQMMIADNKAKED